MKKRLLLILALSVLAAATVGTVTAQSADLLGSGSGDVSVDLPGGSGLPDVTGSLPVCSNLSDDDGDGAVDLADPGCSGPTDGDESNPVAPPTGETTTPPPPSGAP